MSAILTIEQLTVTLPPGADRPHALEGVSLELHRNEILCVVGESGSGKSMTAGAILGLLPEEVHATVRDASCSKARICCAFDDEKMRRIRGARIGMIFQEPMTALNPLRTIGDQIGEMFATHTALSSLRDQSAASSIFCGTSKSPIRKARAVPIRMNSPVASASGR